MSVKVSNPLALSVTWQGQSPAELLTQAGEWLEEQGRGMEAMRYYEAALVVDPSYSLAAFRCGRLALRRQEHAYAVKMLKHALQLTPDHAPTHYLMSLAYAGLGQFERVLASANSALQYDPQHAGAVLQKLRSLAALGRWSEIDHLCRGLPSSILQGQEVCLWRALAATHLGQPEAARSLYKKVSRKVRRRYPEVAKQIEANLENS